MRGREEWVRHCRGEGRVERGEGSGTEGRGGERRRVGDVEVGDYICKRIK